MQRREPHDYTIEVCIICGAQLDRYGTGRCPVSDSHHGHGGMVLRVQPRPLAEQERSATMHYSVVTPALSRNQGDEHA